jgi:flagellar basal-body rod modification protein FlgD
MAYGDQVSLTAGGAPTVAYNLSGAAAGVLVEIRDASGSLVRSISKGASPQGDNSFAWDGKGEDGQSLTAGMYTISVTATDANGKTSSGTPLVQGKVDGVALDGTTPLLTVGGINIPLSDVLTVKGV